MDKRRLILIAILVILVPFMFLQLRKMGTPEPAAPVPQQAQPVVEKTEYADILVANSDISRGSKLNEAHFTWKQWPADVVSQNHVTRQASPDAIGNFTGGVANGDFFSGDPISARRIIMPGEKSIMAALLNPGMRAVTTRISVDTAAGGFIQPGDNVDIILTSSVQGLQGGNSKRYVSETIFENVKVMAIDQTFSNDAGGGPTVIGSTATFEMTQEDAELLNQSVAQGDLSLTLRPIGRGAAPGKSHSVKRSKNEVSHLTIYRDGQPTQVAIRGQ